MTKNKDDWFGGEKVAKSNMKRLAIGNPSESNDKITLVDSIEATYQSTLPQFIDGQRRLLHQVFPRGAEDSVLLWGNFALDQTLPTLPSGTKVRVIYKGMIKRAGGRRQKDILIEYPANTKRVPSPFEAAEATDDVPF